MEVQVKRNGADTIKLPLNDARYSKKVMAEHGLSFSYSNVASLGLRVGDTFTYKGEEYTLNQVEDFKKMSRFVSSYDFVFEGSRHTLAYLFLVHLGARKFSFSGTAEEWLHLFVDCANSKSSGWSVGEFEDLGRVTVEFDSTYILDALTMVAQAMKAEWGIKGKVISLKKTVGTPRALTFEYGKNKGLYSLTRKSLQDKKIVTRAYARGGDKNLPQGMFNYFTVPGYVEKNTELYGIREGEFIDEEIYPHRTGTVTAIAQIDKKLFSISDSSIDFDLNGQKIEGETPYIVFKSGYLEGNQFEITSYNASTKTIRFKANDEGNGNFFPTQTIHAEVGDKYTLIGIRMPQSYIDAAAAELTTKRQEYLNSNSIPRVVYELEVDFIHLARLNTNLDAGDIIRLKDAEKGIDAEIRITEVSYPAVYPDVIEQGMSFDAVIGNEVTYTLFEKIQNDIKEQKEVVTQYNRQSWERDRRNIQALTEFRSKVFDPDGNLENAMQQAIAGWFGTESMYYDLDDVQMTANVGGDPNSFAMTAGRLIHKVFKIEGLGNIWNLTAFSESGLIPTQGYYLAAKCSKTALTGEWVLSTEQIPTNGEPGYWHFNFGYLTTVIEGERTFNPTKGFTLISGGQIETDVLSAYMINVNRLFSQVVTVGSNGFVNAGISGLADNGNQSQRFWAGATEEDRANAPFSVLNDGSMKATKGEIGSFTITASALKVGTNPNGGSWDINSQTVYMTKDYFLMRDNGAVAGERREFSWNLYKDNLGQPRAAAATVYNTINTALPGGIGQYFNVGLEIEADGGNENVALHIRKGDIYVGNKKGYTGKITIANTASTTQYYHFNYINGLVVDFLQNTSPTNPF
ncbi:phage minor structural protein, N-terminal region [Sphingobacterium multivorum]|uniref:phage tail protein n=1 Tax=Sphingobacterium multivorum TaxID=28454 RepID=UPI000E050E39|nr:phage tail protein [Sphingobacterium multivorum]QQT43342.1 phage tail protein [Sphingobacterium multivorum]SUI98519.1 phage minor structural protein, N-terminal region [Sphingobacterium multivorum]